MGFVYKINVRTSIKVLVGPTPEFWDKGYAAVPCLAHKRLA